MMRVLSGCGRVLSWERGLMCGGSGGGRRPARPGVRRAVVGDAQRSAAARALCASGFVGCLDAAPGAQIDHRPDSTGFPFCTHANISPFDSASVVAVAQQIFQDALRPAAG